MCTVSSQSGCGNWDALLIEAKAVHAVRVAEHLHRPSLDVVEQAGREVKVVADQVALR